MSSEPPPLPGYEGSSYWQSPRDLSDLAGFGQRFVGRVIDTLLTAVPSVLVFATTRSPGGISWLGGFYLLVIGLSLLNDVVLTTLKGGTVGKLLVGTRVVVLPDGRPVTAPIAGRRWAAMLVMSFIPFLGLIDDLWIFTGTTRQTLHDKFAETIVVRARRV